MLSVSGPQSLVLSVTRAVARLDLSALSADRMNDRTALSIELQDSHGMAIVSDKLEVTNATVITDSIVVDTEMVATRDVPLMVEDFVKGEPAEGFELLGVYTAEPEWTVAAEQSVLNALEFLTTDNPMDITGATESIKGHVRVRRPSGVKNTLPTEIAVTAEIAEKTIERTMRAMPIEIDGLGTEHKATLAGKKVTVQLTGLYSFINSLSEENVRLFVDVSGLEEGEHTLPVQIHIDNAGKFSCALSMPEVAVTIKAQ